MGRIAGTVNVFVIDSLQLNGLIGLPRNGRKYFLLPV